MVCSKMVAILSAHTLVTLVIWLNLKFTLWEPPWWRVHHSDDVYYYYMLHVSISIIEASHQGSTQTGVYIATGFSPFDLPTCDHTGKGGTTPI